MKPTALLFMVAPVVAGRADAQALGGGEFKRGTVEVAWITQTLNRDLGDALGGSFAMHWGRGALLVKFAPHDRIQIIFGGAVWYEGTTDRFPTRSYRRSNVGLAGRARLWRRGRSQLGVTAGAHYALDFDESPSRYHKRENRFFRRARGEPSLRRGTPAGISLGRPGVCPGCDVSVPDQCARAGTPFERQLRGRLGG